MSSQRIKSRIEILRPRARFVAVTHSSEFIDQGANLGDGFYHVNLHDEQIDSNLLIPANGKDTLILIHNTYLSSFAYNLLLCWLYCIGLGAKKDCESTLSRLLKHNFKKYFAEQLLSANNNAFSRALFLETLLYEQAWMIPVFEAEASDTKLSRDADLGAQLMSLALSSHELGHLYLKNSPELWEELLERHAEVLQSLYSHVAQKYSPGLIQEFKCDVIAVVSCLEQFKSEMSSAFCLRGIVFAFAAFAVLFSLAKSAKKTSKDQKAFPDEIDFKSIEKRHTDYNYSIGLDLDFIERAKLVIEFCKLIAAKSAIDLFGDSGGFPLPATILDDLLHNVDVVVENDDQNARGLSMLVSQSFNEHNEGFDYLVLRSKTFVFGSGRNADGTLRIV